MNRLKFIFCALMWISTHSVVAQNTAKFKESEAIYEEALKLFENEKFSAAKSSFDKYLEYDSKSLKGLTAFFYSSLSGLYLEHPDAEANLVYFVENHSEHPKSGFAYYELGNNFYAQKKYDKAIKYYEEVDSEILSENQKIEMRFKLAYAYFSQKNFDRAKPLFDRIKMQKHKYSSAAYYYSGFISYEKEDYKGAYSDFIEIKDDAAYKDIVAPNIIKILYKNEQYNELIEFAEKNNSSKSSDNSLYVAEAYFFKGNMPKAKQNYERFLSKKTINRSEVNYRYALTLIDAKDYSNASNLLKNTAVLNNDIGQNSAYNLGICYLKMNNKPYALGAFKHASDLDFDMTIKEQSLFSLAKLQFEYKNFNEAIKTLTALNKNFPNTKYKSEVQELLSEAYVNSNNYEQAVNYLKGISNKSTKEKEAYQRATYMLAVRNYNADNYTSAIENFNESLKFPIDKTLETNAHYWKGEAFSKSGKYEDAIVAYAGVFRTDPNQANEYYLKSRYGIAYAYYNTKQFDKALPHFKHYVISARVKDNYLIDATVRLADCHYVGKDYKSAIAEYAKVKLNGKIHLEYAIFQLGIIEYLNGNTESAKENLDIIIKNYPKSTYLDDALFQRAQIDLEAGAFASAVAVFTDLIDKKPNSSLIPVAYSKRAIAYSNLNKPEKEYSDYIFILDKFITHEVAYTVINSLPNTLAKLGKDDEFKKYLDRYKAANPMGSDLKNVEFETAKTLFFNGKYKSAIANFEEFIKSYPNTAQAYEAEYLLAESYKKENMSEKALKSYEKVISDNKISNVTRAIQRAAEIYVEMKNHEQAVKKYEQLAERADKPRDVVKAQQGLMISNFELKNYDKVITYSNNIISGGYADEHTVNSAKLYKGKSTFATGKKDEALNIYRELYKSSKDEYGAEANYLAALNLYENKKYKESMDVLYELNNKYSSYEYWLGKSFILIADNFVAQNEKFQAKATLNSVIDNSPVKEIVEEAKAKLKLIEENVASEKMDETQNDKDEETIDIKNE